MPAVNTIENIRAWFRTCPAISTGNRFSVDHVGRDPTEYAILTTPSPLKTKLDILGNVSMAAVQELNFAFVSREEYGRDVLQNLANLGFFDEVIDWIYAQNKVKNFPVLREGTVMMIVPTMTQYLIQAGTDSGRYQIQCKITYRRNQ